MAVDTELQGALRGQTPLEISSTSFDEEYGALERSELIWRLAAEACGEDHPTEVQPWGLTT